MGSRCSKFKCFPHANSAEKATPGSAEAQNEPGNLKSDYFFRNRVLTHANLYTELT